MTVAQFRFHVCTTAGKAPLFQAQVRVLPVKAADRPAFTGPMAIDKIRFSQSNQVIHNFTATAKNCEKIQKALARVGRRLALSAEQQNTTTS
jgi:hypothetical protein